MKALVTGGAGFIGSNLVDRLLAEQDSVAVVDNLSSGTEHNLRDATAAAPSRFKFHRVDIRDAAGIKRVFAEEHPEIVFHLAAQADVRVSVNDPSLDAAINVGGLLNVLNAAVEHGTRKVVFASSGGTIYGDPAPCALPVGESYPGHPISPYGVSKMVGTEYLRVFNSIHGLGWTSLALSNVYGPRQNPDGEAGVVSIFASQLLSQKECTIYGDGSSTRDYVFVSDVVDAFYRAVTMGDGTLFNIGTGVETGITDLYRLLASLAGIKTPPQYADGRPGELQRSCLDPTLARTVLGWTPQFDVRSGCSAVLDWANGRRRLPGSEARAR